MNTTNNLWLASASPRRLALLEQIGITPARTIAPKIDESAHARETPRDYALRMAQEKAAAITLDPSQNKNIKILAADTVVALGRRILHKTEDQETARAHLQNLSGRNHRVFTALALRVADKTHMRLCQTRVKLKRLSSEEVSSYLASDEWRGKAGAYAIQGRAAAFVMGIIGSYSNVVGLPLYEVVSLLGNNMKETNNDA